MTDNFLQLNADKTEDLISVPPILEIRYGPGSLTSSVKISIRNLGVTMDQALTLDQHVKCLIRSCFFPAEKHCKAQAHRVSTGDGNVNSCFYIVLS